MRWAGLVIAAGLAVACGVETATADPACSRADFEGAVDEAAAKLLEMNRANSPRFQVQLRQLRERRGWSNDQFMTEAAVFVRDDRIAAFDEQSEDLLRRINTLGQEGSATAEPDCKMLGDVRSSMRTLVDAQTAKWSYMFEKLGSALAK